MLNKINGILFYLSFFAFLLNILAYFTGFIEIIEAINYGLIIFGFIGLTLGLMLTKNTPIKLKFAIVGLIFSGSFLWTISIFKILDFAIYWKYALLMIFAGIIWAIWNKVFLKGNVWIRIVFAFSALFLVVCTLLTTFSYFDNSNFLFYSLLTFTSSALIILIQDKRIERKEQKKA